ncbi:hypothetical protein [Amycolatopsis nalaikhensis]|uniref:Uncharacterized protein n=1 Tax=Amycolatopsis nalaikhensis TaxID=715472 RepID=A0ABY8Y085_9PSEU|nr:hypothetical protein [Amycolatopsis sp. 2-2]WIV61262.1 hypothetical protein QP939_22995 [Amycolatopsis sp. 2-2]
MVSGAGFSVDPAELRKFSQFLSGTTQPAVQDAANRMQAADVYATHDANTARGLSTFETELGK